MPKDQNLSGQQDLFSIDDKGTLDLFISIEQDLTNWNVQLNDTYGRRLDWLLGILNIGMLILYYFVGITAIKESPTAFIVASTVFILSLFLSFYYKGLQLKLRFINQRNITNYPLIAFVLHKELGEKGTVLLKRPQELFTILPETTTEKIVDWKLFLFTGGFYFPEPFFSRYIVDRRDSLLLQVTKSRITVTLYILSLLQFLILLYTFINLILP
ncbi:MAG TPA: hypothetical protein VFP97_17575 [Chitinophagaceae bacterium]|nr:hypothetical protein [Chitinophagaceae bacterium]